MTIFEKAEIYGFTVKILESGKWVVTKDIYSVTITGSEKWAMEKINKIIEKGE